MSSFDRYKEIENCDKQKTVSFDSTLTSIDSRAFLMRIADVFTVEGRGVIVTGYIERGVVAVYDTVELISNSNKPRQVVIVGIESHSKTLDEARAGDNVGCLLRGVNREDIKRGDLLVTPDGITPQND